jgi:hypothetical protein
VENPATESIVRAVRRLTVAVWSLSAMLGLFFLLYAWSFWSSSSAISRISTQTTWGPPPDIEGVQPPKDPLPASSVPENLYDLPLEQQIKWASAMAIGRYVRDGDRYKCIIAEVLKVSPGVTFHYKLGDEYRECSYYPRENESRGDGVVLYFVGNPATFRLSTSFSGDRVRSLGDMPLELMRAEIAKSLAQERPPTAPATRR